MTINYVPGLALRFFPGLSRELYDAVDTYLAANSKLAIFTGTAPTEQEIWNMGSFNDYVTANQSNLVYQETTGMQFTYDGYKHKRTIQRFPIDSTNFSPLVDTKPQDLVANPNAIQTPNSLYALIYCPDKDTTLNTADNDLILFIPEVGNGTQDYCSISKVNFKAGDQLYLRNLTVSLFQGYQITDTLITEVQDDPKNPGSKIDVPVGTKKSVYINKNWGNRISEAYRDCFVSRTSFQFKYKTGNIESNPLLNYTQYLNTAASFPVSALIDYVSYNSTNNNLGTNTPIFQLRKYNKTTQTWENSHLGSQLDFNKLYYGYVVNESMINLLNDINNKALLKSYPNLFTVLTSINTTFTTQSRFNLYTSFLSITLGTEQKQDLLPSLLARYCLLQSYVSQDIKDSLIQLLIELGHDEQMVKSALNSINPIDFDLTKYSSNFDKATGILTIQNSSPAKLRTRFKKSVQNPTNEKMYIYIPRYLNRAAIENNIIDTSNKDIPLSSFSSVSYPATTQVLEGEVVGMLTDRIRQQDFTAVSIGKTGDGNVDLEYDNIDIIDYIDSFTVMMKIPNKF